MNNVESFAAVVISPLKDEQEKEVKDYWYVEPLIIQVFGNKHSKILARSRSGVVPLKGDIVHVVTMKNNLKLEEVRQTDEASKSNSLIVGILKADKNKYVYDYDREYKGNLTVGENLEVKKNLTVGENLEVKGEVKIEGKLIIGGKDYTTHTHLPGSFATGQGPVTGSSGGVS